VRYLYAARACGRAGIYHKAKDIEEVFYFFPDFFYFFDFAVKNGDDVPPKGCLPRKGLAGSER
jgi:hypothetical protein